MSYFLPLSDFLEKRGTETADFTIKVADKIKEFQCSLWNQYPDRITGRGNVGTSFARGYMQRMCAPENPPPPAIPPGCQTKEYVFGRYLSKNSAECNIKGYWRISVGQPVGEITSTTPILETVYNTWVLPGRRGAQFALRSMNKTLYDGDNVGDSPSLFIADRDFSLPCINTNSPAYGTNFTYTKTIAKLPTDPTCNERIVYPPTNPPPVIKRNTTINIDADTSIVTNISTTTNNEGDFEFPLTAIINNVRVTVDLGGFTFSPSFEYNTTNKRGGGGSGILPSPAPVPNDVEPPPKLDLEEEDKLEEDPKEETEIEGIAYVAVILTGVPKNAKRQFGDGAPDVIYAGWFEWKRKDYYFNRQPIHFQNCMFKPPEGADGYAYTLYNGFKGFAKVFKKGDN